MSKMKSPSDRKPPLAGSPNQLQPRRILRSSIITQTPPAYSLTKTQESQLRPEYQLISCKLRALAKMVEDEFENHNLGDLGFANKPLNVVSSSPVFERGRFYEEYSVRRNERLRRKKGEMGEEKRKCYDLGVSSVHQPAGKRRDSKKFESVLRRSTPASFSISQTAIPRYSLRSSKENKKPVLSSNLQMSLADGDRKIGAGRVRRA